MTRDELLAFFPSKWNAPTLLGAGSYAVPTLAWLRGPFWEFFHGELWDRDLDKWKVRWSCREFARAYASKAAECWAKTVGGADDGLAVGEFWFDPATTPILDGHAICPAVVDTGRIFIDPQNNQPWAITPAEFESRFFVRF